MSYPQQEHPLGAVGPDETLRTGDVLIKVSGMVGHWDPMAEKIAYQNREGGRYRGGWGWSHLGRQSAPFALFRINPHHGSTSVQTLEHQPEALSYLRELRARAAAELRQRAERLEHADGRPDWRRVVAERDRLRVQLAEARAGCDAAWIPMREREPPALVDIEALVVLRGHCAFPTAPGAMMWRQPDGHTFNIPAATHWRPVSEVAP